MKGGSSSRTQRKENRKHAGSEMKDRTSANSWYLNFHPLKRPYAKKYPSHTRGKVFLLTNWHQSMSRPRYRKKEPSCCLDNKFSLVSHLLQFPCPPPPPKPSSTPRSLDLSHMVSYNWALKSWALQPKAARKCHGTGSVHCGGSQSSCFRAGRWSGATGKRKAIRPPAAKGEEPREPRLKVWKALELREKDQWKVAVKPGLAYGTTWGGW